ncbi:D-glycero-alpha-D-manno-heptose-1 7-bisphosphate 7-phosphatase [termite gut metagenome]|uniref:D-glycero-alpha-D-manno-heptose-1 7-bisphosphate 7-phosphatase n=1 Tax=termite gut metagenome TaxID=433724 RepID=A0A5J4QI47_9ZZZZ
MKVVIVAGGKGTRIASLNSEIPKAMIPVNGKPVLEWQVELAKRYAYTHILLIIGYLGDSIRSYCGNGSKWGVCIEYFEETCPFGTAGALVEIKHLLIDDFFVFYGDTIMDVDLNEMLFFHQKHHSDATLFLHPNDHPYDSDLIEIRNDNWISHIYSKPHPENFVYRNLVNAALYILSPKIISYILPNSKSDFGKNVFPKCLEIGLKFFGYISSEYIKDMGTPDRYEKVCNDVMTGKVARLNKKYPQPAIFLDRDGVVSKEVDLLYRPEQISLIEGVAEAIQYMNEKEYLVVIVTNQPVIARNLCSIEELEYIHKKLETLLGAKHAYVNAIYYCPHHPDSGYPEERKEYKILCNCRKPNPGMLLQAAKEWNISLAESFMIGDRESDRLAGVNAGVKQSILIEQNKPFALLNLIQTLI